MRRIFQLTLFLLLVVMTACGGAKYDMDLSESVNSVEESYAPPATMQASAPEETTLIRKLIKEGYISYETESLEASRKKILNAVTEFKGYISTDESYQNDTRTGNHLLIRVPSQNFDRLLNRISEGVEKFDYKKITVKDVTEEFLDIEARLKTKKELEVRYLQLLQKAQTVKDMIEIEKQIEQLRSDIESIEGRLKFLENQSALSTLNITRYETTTVSADFGQQFIDGFRNGWEGFILFFVFLTNIWPFLLIGIGLFFGIKIYIKKKRQLKKS